MKKLYIVFLFTLAATGALAQASSCAQSLRLAQSVYDQGRLHELEDLITKTITSQTAPCSQAEQVSLLKLLTLTYIYLEEPAKADDSMLKLLLTNPYFRPNKDVDPAEFMALYRTFRTRPVYRLGAKFGVNLSQPNVASFNPISTGESSYDFKIGVGGGIAGEYLLTTKLKIVGEVQLTQKKFTNTSVSKFYSITEDGGTDELEFSETTGLEKQGWLSIPILLQYEFIKKEDQKFIPIIEIGVGSDLLLISEIEIERKRVANQSLDAKTFNNRNQREPFNLSGIIGVGARVAIASGYLVADIRYYQGLKNINSTRTLFTNQQQTFDYTLTDGIYKLNSVGISVGYVQNFFKPKKTHKQK